MSKSNPLKIWEAIKLGFKIPFLNPSIFIPAAVNSVVSSIFTFFTMAYYQPEEAPGLAEAIMGVLSPVEFIIFLLLVMLIAMFATIVIVKMAYDSIDGKPNMSEALSLAIKKFIPIIIASIFYGSILFFGFALFIVPGIFLLVKLIFYMYAIMFEDKGIFASLSASWRLVKGNWWRVFVLAIFWSGIVSIPQWFAPGLDRMAESLATFVFYLLWQVWVNSSFAVAYKQLRGFFEKTENVVQ